MLEISEAFIRNFALHIVGNKACEDGVKASKEIVEPMPEVQTILKNYFLKSFTKQNETSRFGPAEDLSSNKVYQSVSKIFNHPDDLLKESVELLNHLYDQSSHPHIKSGELCVAIFDDVVLEGEVVEAIGIFKSELKETFLGIDEQPNKIQYNVIHGININKLDKGCIVFNTEESDGYRVMMVDSNNYDTQYWKEDFLNLIPESVESVQTKYALEMVQQFTDEVLSQQEDKKEQLAMMNKSVQFFEEEESFDVEEFAEKVLQSPEYIDAFKEYRPKFEEERGIDEISSFEIEQAVVEKKKKKMNNLIKLDNNIQIRLDFDTEDSIDKYIEKGYDEVKGMHYYVVYFNNEIN